MFNITPVMPGVNPQKNMPVRKQAAPANEPRFGLTTISGEPQFAAKTRPITPAPTQPKVLGGKLDFYA